MDARTAAIDIMPSLQRHMKAIENAFGGGTINLSQFAAVLSRYLPTDPRRDQMIVAIFDAADCDSVGAVAWKDFTSFCVDSISVRRSNVDMYLQPYRPFPLHMMPTKRPTGCYRSRAVMTANGPRMYYLTRDLGITCYDPRALTYESIVLPWAGKVQDFCMVPGYNSTAIASQGPELLCVDNRSKHVQKAVVTETQTCIQWSERNHLLMSGARHGDILLWDLKTNSLVQCAARVPVSKGLIPAVHTQHVTDAVFWDTSLVTSSFDGTVCLLDLARRTVLSSSTPLESHGITRPVTCMSLCKEYALVACGGMTTVPALLMLQGNRNSKPFLLQDPLDPHSKNVCGVSAFPWGCQLATCDTGGVVKIWDIRTCRSIQTISLNDLTALNSKKQTWTTLCMPTDDVIVLGTDYDMFVLVPEENHETRSLSDDGPIRGVSVHEATDTVITVCRCGFRVWSLRTGRAVNAFSDRTTHPISVHCMDPNGRKLYVGCEDGTVGIFSIETGTCMALYEKVHKEEVSTLTHIARMSLVVTTGVDWSIVILSAFVLGSHQERDSRRVSQELRCQCSSSLYVEAEKVLILLAATGDVYLYDIGVTAYIRSSFMCIPKQPIALRACDGLNIKENTRSVNAMQSMGGSLIVFGDTKGWLTLWNWRDLRFAMEAWLLTPSPKAGMPSVTCMRAVMRDGHAMLYVGDDQGFVSVYDMARSLLSSTGTAPPLMAHVEVHREAVTSIDVGLTLRVVATSSSDGCAYAKAADLTPVGLFDRSHEVPFRVIIGGGEDNMPAWPVQTQNDDGNALEELWMMDDLEDSQLLASRNASPRNNRRGTCKTVLRGDAPRAFSSAGMNGDGLTGPKKRLKAGRVLLTTSDEDRSRKQESSGIGSRVDVLLRASDPSSSLTISPGVEPLQVTRRRSWIARMSVAHPPENTKKERGPEVSHRTLVVPPPPKVEGPRLDLAAMEATTASLRVLTTIRHRAPSAGGKDNPQSLGALHMSILRPMSAIDMYRPVCTNPYTRARSSTRTPSALSDGVMPTWLMGKVKY